MKKHLHFLPKLVLLLTCWLGALQTQGQTYTIGTGTAANSGLTYPTPFGDYYVSSRQQFLFQASELTAAGASAGLISAVSWNVTALNASGAHAPYTIKISSTTVAALGTTTWQPAGTTVYTTTSYTPTVGLNSFTFSTPFTWNGTDNILLEICHGNGDGISFSENASVNYTTTTFNSSRTFRSDTEPSPCSYTGTNTGSQNATRRPNTTFTIAPSVNCSGQPSAGTPTATTYNVCPGATTTLSVTGATAASGITYQWQQSTSSSGPFTNVTAGSGGTTTQYTTPTYVVGNDTFYRLLVTCSFSGLSDSSAPVLVTAPVGPTTQTSNIGTSAILSQAAIITMTAGTGLGRAIYINSTNSFTPPSNGVFTGTVNTVYQNAGQQLIGFTTATSVTVTGLTPGTTYYVQSYEADQCLVNSVYTTYFNIDPATGNPGQFTTDTPPANDSCSGAFAIFTTPNATVCTGTPVITTGATQQQVPVPSCTSTGNNDDVWFLFTANSGDILLRYDALTATVGTAGTVGYALYSGACGSLTQIACNSGFGSGGTGTSPLIGGLTVNDTYYLRVFVGGTLNSGTFNLCVQDTTLAVPASCATISSPTNNATGVSLTPTISFGSVASASQYDIFLGTSAANATLLTTTSSLSYTITTSLAGNTQYFVYVVPKNAAGPATGCSATAISFTTLTPAPNDLPVNAIALTVNAGCTTPTQFNNTNSTATTGEPFARCASTTSNNSVFYKFMAPANGAVRVSTDQPTLGSITDTRIALFSATDPTNFSTFALMGCDEDNGTSGSGFTSTIYATGLNPGDTYYVSVEPFSNGTFGTFCLTVNSLDSSMLVANGSCVAAQSLYPTVTGYRGWTNLVDATGDLIAWVRDTSGTISQNSFSNTTSGTAAVTVNSGAVRQDSSDATLPYYLDRNWLINSATAVPANTSVMVRLPFRNTELAALQLVNTGATLSNISVRRQTGTVCRPSLDSAQGIESTIAQSDNSSTSDVSWVTFYTPGFSNFYLEAGGGPLALDLVDVTAANAGSRNRVNWTTAKETAGDQYEIQRSANGRDFVTVGVLRAKGTASSYTFWDEKPLAGVNYYRINAVEASGKNNYSKVVTATVTTNSAFALQAFPNPTSDVLTVTVGGVVKGEASVMLTDATGKVIRTQLLTGSQVVFDLHALPAGLYLVRYTDGARTETVKVTKQ